MIRASAARGRGFDSCLAPFYFILLFVLFFIFILFYIWSTYRNRPNTVLKVSQIDQTQKIAKVHWSFGQLKKQNAWCQKIDISRQIFKHWTA